MIFTISKTKYIIYDEISERACVIDTEKLNAEIEQAQAKLASIPETLSDKELLDWAKRNHPMMMDYSVEKAKLQEVISLNTSLLQEVK